MVKFQIKLYAYLLNTVRELFYKLFEKWLQNEKKNNQSYVKYSRTKNDFFFSVYFLLHRRSLTKIHSWWKYFLKFVYEFIFKFLMWLEPFIKSSWFYFNIFWGGFCLYFLFLHLPTYKIFILFLLLKETFMQTHSL